MSRANSSPRREAASTPPVRCTNAQKQIHSVTCSLALCLGVTLTLPPRRPAVVVALFQQAVIATLLAAGFRSSVLGGER
jgi:hypothetical protein